MPNGVIQDSKTQVPLPIWARHGEVKRLTGCPEKWLVQFAKDNPKSVRKFGNGNTNGTLIFKVADVLKAIDKGVRQ